MPGEIRVRENPDIETHMEDRMKCVPGKAILTTVTKINPLLAFVLALCVATLLPSRLAAQNTTSPQGGAAIYSGPAVCVSSQNIAGSQNFQPCMDSSNNGQWFTVMNASVKTSTNKTLFVSPSLVTGIYTNTQVKGNGGSQTATAVASVAVRVLLDCANCSSLGTVQTQPALFPAGAGFPDQGGSGIVFDARIQQLTAVLGQAITSACIGDITTCSQEMVDLILSTTSAHTFNFILPEVGAGQHTITVQARLDAGNICYNNSGAIATCSASDVVNTSLGSSVAAAVFGLGSLTVTPVQLAPGFSF
jgi:hypothetical protein